MASSSVAADAETAPAERAADEQKEADEADGDAAPAPTIDLTEMQVIVSPTAVTPVQRKRRAAAVRNRLVQSAPRRRRGGGSRGGGAGASRTPRQSAVCEPIDDADDDDESADDSHDELLSDIATKSKRKADNDDGACTPKERKKRKKRRFLLSVQKIGVPGRKRKRDDATDASQSHSAAAAEKEVSAEPENLVMPNPSREQLLQFSPLQLLCDHFIRNMHRKDPEEYFVFPVTDDVAPDYNNVIKRTIDIYTMRLKINRNEYENLQQFKDDAYLIYENAVEYNTPDTVYYLAAQKYKLVIDYQFSQSNMEHLAHDLPFYGSIEPHLITGAETKQPANDQSSEGMSTSRSEQSAGTSALAATSGGGAIKLNMVLPEHVGDAAGRHRHRAKTLADRVKGECPAALVRTAAVPHDRFVPPRLLDYGGYASFAPSYDSTWATADIATARRMDPMLARLPGAWAKSDRAAEAAASVDAIDFEQLRTLRQLGIDVAFLDALEPAYGSPPAGAGDAASPSALLDSNASLLARLRRAQYERLSLPPPKDALNRVRAPSIPEIALADNVANNLVKLLATVKNEAIVSRRAIRAAVVREEK